MYYVIKEETFVGTSLFFSTLLLTMFGKRVLSLLPKNMFRHQRNDLVKSASTIQSSLIAPGNNADHVAHWMSRDGEHAYLKEVEGETAIAWVKSRNEHCLSHIGAPNESPLYEKILTILDSKEKIPYVRKIGDYYYNFWQDKANTRGLWRRTSLESYKTSSPEWEVVLDVDALCVAEGESWVYKGHTLYENSAEDKRQGVLHHRTLLKLSRGGSDAVVVREFDLLRKAFVGPEEGGFTLPEAKSSVSWKSIDLLLVGTDMRDGASMTDSGYPRVVREWARGSGLGESTTVYEGEQQDVSVSGYVVSVVACTAVLCTQLTRCVAVVRAQGPSCGDAPPVAHLLYGPVLAQPGRGRQLARSAGAGGRRGGPVRRPAARQAAQRVDPARLRHVRPGHTARRSREGLCG